MEKRAIPPASAVHYGQYETKYVVFRVGIAVLIRGERNLGRFV